ncbi:MAG: beta-ketoacyl-[acyl-carrier-protein] synthase family protein [Myxococcota bacterium]
MRDWSRQVVITGAGVVCNMGHDLEALSERLRCGDAPAFTRWPPAVEYGAKCQVIGEYLGDLDDATLGLSKREGRFMARASRLALKAAQIALAQSGVARDALGVIVGSGTGDVPTHIEMGRRLERHHDTKKVGPVVIPKIMASTVSANLVNSLRTRGPSATVAAACAGGTYNILIAAQLIEAGFMDAAIAGGVESTDIHFHAGFDAMRAYNSVDNDHPERASRPYAADRAGFIFGEGAGMLILETREAARRRGAPILGAIAGYGMSSDGEGEMVSPSPDGAYRAMTQALAHAELAPDAIGYVNTHGTSTPVGDVSEVAALRRCFGERNVMYSSTKGYTNHTISAAGAIEAVFTLEMLRAGWVAPSVHADPLDPALVDYAPVRQPLDVDLAFAASNSFGFGGTNATLILSREPRRA